MKRTVLVLAVLALGMCCAGMAGAESIEKRVGATGRIGLIVPGDSDNADVKLVTDLGLKFGGGIIYGYSRNIALEFDVTHSWFGSETPSQRDTDDFRMTDFSIGAQYRFPDRWGKVTPYGGAGIDILLNDYDHGDVDTMVGVHFAGGADYFITRDLAINSELKIVAAPDADITNNGVKTGNFDPSSLSLMFGVRYFFW